MEGGPRWDEGVWPESAWGLGAGCGGAVLWENGGEVRAEVLGSDGGGLVQGFGGTGVGGDRGLWEGAGWAGCLAGAGGGWGFGATGHGGAWDLGSCGGTGVGAEMALRGSFSGGDEGLLSSNMAALPEDSSVLLLCSLLAAELTYIGSEDFRSCSSFLTVISSSEFSL